VKHIAQRRHIVIHQRVTPSVGFYGMILSAKIPVRVSTDENYFVLLAKTSETVHHLSCARTMDE
jgi:hypothetical protein